MGLVNIHHVKIRLLPRVVELIFWSMFISVFVTKTLPSCCTGNGKFGVIVTPTRCESGFVLGRFLEMNVA